MLQSVLSWGGLATRFGKGMALKRKLSAGRIWITNEFFIVICWVISVLLPKRRWYGAVLAFARLLAHTAGSFAPETNKASDASLVPRLLHRFLDILAVRFSRNMLPSRAASSSAPHIFRSSR